MNVYDFDKTIYSGDSTLDFYFFCLNRYPGIITCIPKQLTAGIKYKAGMIDKTHFKEEFYCFFSRLKDVNGIVLDFWNKNEGKIKKWYTTVHKEDDVIISASPYFLLEEICNRIKIHNLIASEVDSKTGKYSGINCYGEEKVRCFRERFDSEIENFYSDSKSDQPMADIARNKFIVKGNKIIQW